MPPLGHGGPNAVSTFEHDGPLPAGKEFRSGGEAYGPGPDDRNRQRFRSCHLKMRCYHNASTFIDGLR